MAFRRRNKDSEPAPSGEAAVEALDAEPEFQDAHEDLGEEEAWADDDLEVESGAPSFPPARAERDGGPWDSGDLGEDKIERVDLGGILVPIVDGMELRAEIAEERVVAATLVVGRSAIQIQPFAAPRTMGIWDDVRGEIAEGIGQGGGTVRQLEGRFGLELVAEVPVGLPDGTVGLQAARFLGVDGPRWFLRAVITGEGALDASAREPLEELFADVVVVRGSDPMAPREPIALRLPGEMAPSDDPSEAAPETFESAQAQAKGMDDFNPFERGPEIQEIR